MKKRLCYLLILALTVATLAALIIPAAAENTAPTNTKGTYGLTFDASNPLTISGDVTVEPNTLSATVYLPTSYTARAGAVFGNYSGASGRSYTLEISTNGQPRLFVQATNSTAVNLIFNQLDVRGDAPRRVSIVMDKAGKTATCYVSDLSGNLIGSQTMTSTVAYPTFTVDKLYMIGGDYRTDNAQWFRGEILEVAMYTGYRTAEQCKTVVDVTDKTMICGFDLTKADPDYKTDLSGNGHNVINADEIESDWLATNPNAPTDYAYSFAIVGDTQFLVYNDANNGTSYTSYIYDWLLANKDAKKIQYVMGLDRKSVV